MLRYDQRNFTVNHLVDVIRGSKNKKVLSSEWNRDPIYNSASSRFSAGDSNRLVRHLVLQTYLREELVVTRDGMASAYLRTGPKAATLTSGILDEKVVLDVQAPKRASIGGSASSSATNSQDNDAFLQKLEEECFDLLKVRVLQDHEHLKSAFTALPSECYQEIAARLPRSKAEIMDVDQMTEARFAKYGEGLLEICEQFYGRRQEYLKTKTAEYQRRREEMRDFASSSPAQSESSSSGYRATGFGSRGG